MMIMAQQGAGLLVALMIAMGAPEETPAGTAAPRLELVAAAAPVTGPADNQEGNAKPAYEGAFRRLLADDQRMARTLLNAEQVGPNSGPAWSLDRIAAAKEAGKDWENIVTKMQAQRLIAANSRLVLEARAKAPNETDGEELADLGMAGGAAPGKPNAEAAKPSHAPDMPTAAAKRASGCDVGSAETEKALKIAVPAKAN